jgi:hypothetical protein
VARGHARPAHLSALVDGVARRLLTVALLPALILATCGPQLFSTVFGPASSWSWSGSGSASYLNLLAVTGGLVALSVGGLVLRDTRAAILLFSITGLVFGRIRLFIGLRLAGCGIRSVARHALRLVAYVIPMLLLVLLARWVDAGDRVVGRDRRRRRVRMLLAELRQQGLEREAASGACHRRVGREQQIREGPQLGGRARQGERGAARGLLT